MRPVPPPFFLRARLRSGGCFRQAWFSQVASMVTRWTQALVHEKEHFEMAAWAPARKQLYVDDPAIVSWGSPDSRAVSFSLIILFWLVLGDSTFVEQRRGV